MCNYYNIYVYNMHDYSKIAHLTEFFAITGHKSLNTNTI